MADRPGREESEERRPRPRRPRRDRGEDRESLPSGADRTIHALLAIFLGTWGIHKFAQGNTPNGIIRAVIGFFTCLPTLVVGIAEGIQYFGMSDEEYARAYLRDKKDWF